MDLKKLILGLKNGDIDINNLTEQLAKDATKLIGKSVEKLGEVLAGPLATLAELVSKGDQLKMLAKVIFFTFTAISAIKLGMLIGQFGGLMASLFGASAGAITLTSALTAGISAIAVAGAIAYLMSSMNDAVSEAESRANSVKSAGDMFSAKGVTTV